MGGQHNTSYDDIRMSMFSHLEELREILDRALGSVLFTNAYKYVLWCGMVCIYSLKDFN